jgi:myo-inositol-1(or 4)-monophosphatase
MTYQAELAFAKQLAHDAGEVMRRYFRTDDTQTSWKSDNTPLTIADTTINRMVIDAVKQTFPTHAVIGEEESYECDGAFVWVVDPIDGTMPYSLGIPTSTFSLALVRKDSGQPVVSVVYDPYLDQLYEAVAGEGARRNNAPVSASAQETLQQGYVLMWHGNHQPQTYFDKTAFMDGVHTRGGRYFVVPSFVYFASRVASGEFVGAVLDYGSPWDPAAATLLVREAGGIVTDIHGNQRRFDAFSEGCIMAANQRIHQDLLELIAASQP